MMTEIFIKSNGYPANALCDIKNQTFISFLDLSRWLAAAMVFVGHLRNPMFFGYSDLDVMQQTLPVKLWYFITGWHMEAVIVFFVLSGFLVGGLSCAKISSNSFRPSAFAIDRITRLYAAFLPALLLTYLLDMSGNYFFGSVGFWDHSHPMIAQKVSTVAFETILNPQTFIGNLAMLQEFTVEPLGSNQPLWSISMEFWFYTIFGLIALGWISSGMFKNIIMIGASLIIVFLLGQTFFVYLGLWFIGLVLAFIPYYRRLYPTVALFLFLLILTVVRLKQNVFDQDETFRIVKNYIVAFSFGLLILSMRNQKSKVLIRMAKINRFFADFSYSLYLIHFPLMLFLLATLSSTGKFHGIKIGYSPTNGLGVILYIFIIIIVYLIAWVFAQGTEAQTWRIRKYIKRRFVAK